MARRIKAIGEDLTSQLKGLVPSFQLFSLALDKSTDIDDTAQLLIFVRGISENFEITEELLSMESMKDTTTGKDIFECVENAFRTMELPWQKWSVLLVRTPILSDHVLLFAAVVHLF